MENNVLEDNYLEKVNRKRLRIRKVLLYLSIPFLLLVLLFTGRVAYVYVSGHNIINAYEASEFGVVKDLTGELKRVTFMEDWLAYYSSGTSAAKQGDYITAESELLEALSRASYSHKPYPGYCLALNNLAWTYNKMGDEARDIQRDLTRAEDYYTQSSTMLLEAPPECDFPETSSSMSDIQEDSEQKADEVAGEIEEGANNPDSEGEPESSNDSDNSEGETLEERINNIQEELNQSSVSEAEDDRSQPQNSSETGNSEVVTPSKPW